jgi:membrane-bound lytic murein transglycosylase B
MHQLFRTLGAAALLAAVFHSPALGQAVTRSPTPMARPAMAPATPAERGFLRWVGRFRAIALKHGISTRTFDAAFRDVHLNTDVLQKEAHQSEFVKPIWVYLDHAVSDTRIRNGRAAMRKYRHLLDRIEARYGVDKKIVVAIWGIESAYGARRGSIPLVESLATLSYAGQRQRFFETQLLDTLKILQHGDVAPRNMTGSWAGATGHTQFMPSSYLAYAVDFTGDGKRDIWSNNPADALASTAAYLARMGWRKGQPWGVEVTLPRGFNYAATGHRVTRSVADWARLGVRPARGGRLPDYGPAEVLLPAGARGAAFLIFHNFDVIRRYNAADAYVIAVGYLGDRIAGGPPLRASWPRGDRALDYGERVELQDRLNAAGFSTHGADGKIGPKTVAAVRAYQRSIGMVPDGYASFDILKSLR